MKILEVKVQTGKRLLINCDNLWSVSFYTDSENRYHIDFHFGEKTTDVCVWCWNYYRKEIINMFYDIEMFLLSDKSGVLTLGDKEWQELTV